MAPHSLFVSFACVSEATVASSLTHPQRSATVHTCRRSTPYPPSSLAPSYVPYFGALLWLYFLSLSFSNSHVDSSSTLQRSPTNVKTQSSEATMALTSEPTETCIFSSQNCPWGGQRRRVLAIEGKTPGSKPPDLFLVWAFLPLASSRGTSASPPATRQNSPGI